MGLTGTWLTKRSASSYSTRDDGATLIKLPGITMSQPSRHSGVAQFTNLGPPMLGPRFGSNNKRDHLPHVLHFSSH